MKIIIRKPEPEPYAYVELEFSSTEEYKEKYPEFVKTHYELKMREQKFKEKLNFNTPPFNGDEYAK